MTSGNSSLLMARPQSELRPNAEAPVGLTGFPGGDVDGGEEGARARRVEAADREEKLRVPRQATHRDRCLVPRHPDFPHGLRLGVVLPVNHLTETERADWTKISSAFNNSCVCSGRKSGLNLY